MGKSVLRHPRRSEAEEMIRQRRLRAKEIAKACDTSIDSIRRWAREMGIVRYRALRPTEKAQ